MTNTANLSAAAQSALLSTGTNRQGAKPTHPMTPAVKAELVDAGLLGTGGGLTRSGTIARERLNVIPF